MAEQAHPAKFTDVIIDAIQPWVLDDVVLVDQFAGTGKIHRLDGYRGCRTIGIEIEPEWANMHPNTIVGNALRLPFKPGYVGMFATSPCYGNRMADAHNAQERCKACKGTGKIEADFGENMVSVTACGKCGGLGRRTYKRLTYTHQLGRKLHPENSGAMQWGKAYREFHIRAWAEMTRLEPSRFVLNIKNHIRNHIEVDVTGWHRQVIEALGWDLIHEQPIEVPNMGYGENAEARAEHEWVLVFDR